MVPDYNTVDKAKSLMEKVRNGEVVTQEELMHRLMEAQALTAPPQKL